MRSVLALSLLIALGASANAAQRGRHVDPRAFAGSPSAAAPIYITPGGARIYRDPSVQGGLRTDHDNPPSYNDPSRFGGG